MVGLVRCEWEGIVGGDEGPLAESRRLLVTESKLSEYMERKKWKRTVKCG